MKNRFPLLIIVVFSLASFAFGQLSLPRDSNGATISQTIGDTKVTIVYHRPNTKGRKVWGGLVPFGEVWRTGANENTTFEVSRDVTINGQMLPAGKYGLHTIPNKTEWVIIFSKKNDEWGSFNYKQENDALRIKAIPAKTKVNRDSFMFEFESVTNRSTQVALSWEKLKVGFALDIGDISGRTLSMIREAIKNRKADDIRPLNQGAGYVFTFKVKENYEEAIGWLNESIRIREGFGNLQSKARLLAEMGKTKEAIETGERAIEVGKKATPPANTADFEKVVAGWKSGK